MTKHYTPRDFIDGPMRGPDTSQIRNPSQPDFTFPSPHQEQLAPCVALIGCDGSGKSTLARDLVSLLDRHSPTRSVYLGLGTGDFGRRIAQWPLMGALVSRYLSNKALKAHDGRSKHLPGVATALVMVGLSLARLRRFRKALADRRNGIQVITDRYPQAEIAGSFDGPGLNWTRTGSAMVEYLARREHGLYQEMAKFRPTVVIRLNVDIDTALARKADHERALLEKKIAIVPTLHFAGAPIIDIDATRPYGEVLASVLAVLRRFGLQA